MADEAHSSNKKFSLKTGLALGALLLAGVIGYLLTNDGEDEVARNGARAGQRIDSALVVTGWRWEGGVDGGRFISGNVKNYSARSFPAVKLEFELYDANGRPLGRVAQTLKKVAANETHGFRMPVSQQAQAATEARLAGITEG